MSSIGDISVTMGLDDANWVRGALRVQGSARQLGGAISGELGRSVGQVGFMIQDFSSVLAMGGKNSLGRALMSTMNNVQMLGAAFGPMGMAITSIGGGLASILIPKLLESGEAAKTFADNIKEAVSAVDRMNGLNATMARQGNAIGQIQTAKGAKGKIEDLDSDLGINRRAQGRLSEALGMQYRDAMARGLISGPMGGASGDLLKDLPMSSGVGGEGQAALDELRKSAESLKKLRDEEYLLNDARQRAAVKLRELTKAEEQAEQAKLKEKILAEEDKVIDQLHRQAEQEEREQERKKQQESDAYERALKRQMADADREGARAARQGPLASVSGGEAYRAFLASAEEQKDLGKEALDIATQQRDLLRDQLDATRNLAETIVPIAETI